jgi:predicted small metal-binding protein
MRRALLCECHLEAWDEEELVSEVLVHLRQKHLGMKQQQEAQVN